MMALAVIAWLIALPVLVTGLTFCAEVAMGLWRYTDRTVLTDISIAILMPAHNEAEGIGETVRSLLPTLPSRTRLVVIADNCSDNTASIAREAGAEVIERTDPVKRGKGYALAFGRDHLRASPPDCLVILDADCLPELHSIARIATMATARNAAVQSTYLLRPAKSGAPLLEISGFAFLVKNLVRQQGLMRIGAPVVLTGSGMAFPWAMLANANLATGDIVEDLGLGIKLASEGHPVLLSSACVWTDPSSTKGTLTQRTRWENGFVATAKLHALPLLAKGARSGRLGLLWLGLHLAVPPLALLIALTSVALLVEGGLWALIDYPAPLLTIAFLLLFEGCLVLLAWLFWGRNQMRVSTILRLPLYLLWKIPVYLKLLRGGETRWIRTERNGG